MRGVEYASATGWQPAVANEGTWAVPCGAAGCRVRYQFALREAALALDDVDTAIASGDVVVAPPSTWLLHPDAPRGAGRFRFHGAPAPASAPAPSPPARLPVGFLAGTLPSPDGAADTFEASTEGMDASSFAVFGGFLPATVASGTSRVDVAVAPWGLGPAESDVVACVQSAVDGIAAYLGRFPAPHTLVIVMSGKAGPNRGETLGDGGPAVLVRIGAGVTAAALREDWVLTHELLHVSLPTVSRQHVWFSEGVPSYVEPIVRARAGILAPEKFGGDLASTWLPQGQPEAGDEGLERTHTWGRTYWGGALFCLIADVTIRERTGNTRSFDDVLRAVSRSGADVETHWELDRWLDEGDRATGTRVLHDLYREMALAPKAVDLAALWSTLGVRADGGRVTFDDRAPLAALRRSISERRREPISP